MDSPLSVNDPLPALPVKPSAPPAVPALPAVAAIPKPPPRRFTDVAGTRKAIYDGVLDAVRSVKPAGDGMRRLELVDAEYIDPETATKKQEKKAVLTGDTLGRRIRGTWRLVNEADGTTIAERQQIVARVPHMTDAGALIHNGNVYTINNQQRLRAGLYTRRKANGEIETHFNASPGKGRTHRYSLDPAKSLIKVNIDQSEIPIYPLLKSLGATDEEMETAWGRPMMVANKAKGDGALLRKLAGKFLRGDDTVGDDATLSERLAAKVSAMELDPETTQATLGKPFTNLNKDALLAATAKMLAISRGTAEPDDRDHPRFQSVHGPEDLFRERIVKDHSRILRDAARKVMMAGSLDAMPSGLLTRQLDQLILGSGLAGVAEETNPAEIFDKVSKITRLGEGGISKADTVPDSTRALQAGHYMLLDPSRTPESGRAGIDLYAARHAMRGGGSFHIPLRNSKTGEVEQVRVNDLDGKVIAFPRQGEFRDPEYKRIPAMKDGRIVYRSPEEMDYTPVHFEDGFSPLANLIPFKAGAVGNRLAMGGRMYTQALPLSKNEAPLVRNAVPESPDRSFNEEYGERFGAVRASAPGTVTFAGPGVVRVVGDDGKENEIELYDNHPYARKTFINQTPVVKAGDRIEPGQLIAKSNYTDDKGHAAMGLNVRIGYLPRYHQYEDSVSISESMAKRMTSEHAYMHDLRVDDATKPGRRDYLGYLPGKFTKEQFDTIDDNGLVKPGTVVRAGDPLILALRTATTAENKVHRKGQAAKSDAAVIWEKEDEGVVTDVAMGRDGPTVVVKSLRPMKVGDKASGLFGDKGIVSAIIPDHDMPTDEQGRPLELLVSDTGIISRGNPAQAHEALLGKIAAMRGRPYILPDFQDVDDMNEHVMEEGRRNGVKLYETVTDPITGRKIPNVAVGNRFIMKLAHQAEDKVQGRGGGAYDASGSPAKGGYGGCFAGNVRVDLADGTSRPIRDLVRAKVPAKLRVRDPKTVAYVDAVVVDWFERRVDAGRMVDVTYDDGTVVAATECHVFYLKDGTPVRAGDLQPGDELMASA